MSDPQSEFFVTVPSEMSGERLDKAVSTLLNQHSRANIQQWLKNGMILVDGKKCKQKQRLIGGETLHITIPEPEPADWPAQDLLLDIVYQDEQLIVINKPPGMVVHPGAGNPDRTLLNGLLFIDPGLDILPRAGIVHRIDKDTSGLLVVARTESARTHLINQLQDHSMHRVYLAVANGVMVAGETIDQPIGRHRQDRIKMAVTHSGKPAITHLRVMCKFRRHCLVRANLETGRTHQIRVHMAWRGYPLVGDPTYGGRLRLPDAPSPSLTQTLNDFRRQALHAFSLSLIHPKTGESMTWTQPIPQDMITLTDELAKDAGIKNPIMENGLIEHRP